MYITRANVSTRNKRFRLDFTSWELCLENEMKDKEGDKGSYIALSNGDGSFEAPNPPNPVKAIPEWVPNCPTRL